jgi:hypothetical protein
MRLQTTRDLRGVWLVAGLVFVTSVVIVRSFDHSAPTQTLGLWVGYIGLAALGAALLASSYWVGWRSTSSRPVRAGVSVLLALAFLLWLLALIFPFL